MDVLSSYTNNPTICNTSSYIRSVDVLSFLRQNTQAHLSPIPVSVSELLKQVPKNAYNNSML